MKYRPGIILLLASVFFSSCFLRPPSATITDRYIQVKSPGQYWGLSEVRALAMDSTFNYPSRVEYLTSYTIVKKKNNEQPDGNVAIKSFFSEKSKRYYWKIRKDPLLADYILKDTIVLKPHTWYELSTERYNYMVYFYWNGKKGEYILKEKPKPGAW